MVFKKRKIIALIICVCFLWQETGFASDFLRQAQLAHQGQGQQDQAAVSVNANGEDNVSDDIGEYAKGILRRIWPPVVATEVIAVASIAYFLHNRLLSAPHAFLTGILITTLPFIPFVIAFYWKAKVAHILSLTDNKTGLPNHRAFEEHADMAIDRIKRHKEQRLALYIIDIDDFKLVNDKHGHIIGDDVLTRIAEILRSSGTVRHSDLVARWGGEEFAVLLNETTADKRDLAPDWYQVPATRILKNIRTDKTLLKFMDNKPVTVSIGIVEYPKGEEYDLKTLMEYADKALYQAKEQGKDRFVVYGSATGGIKSAANSSGLFDKLALCFTKAQDLKTGRVRDTVAGQNELTQMIRDAIVVPEPVRFAPETVVQPEKIDITSAGPRAVLVVGADGYIGKEHLAALPSAFLRLNGELSILGGLDLNAPSDETQALFKETNPGVEFPPFFKTPEEAIKACELPAKNIIALICSPNPVHFQNIRELAELGVKEFIVEKPIADTLEEMDEIIKYADEKSLKLIGAGQVFTSDVADAIQAVKAKHGDFEPAQYLFYWTKDRRERSLKGENMADPNIFTFDLFHELGFVEVSDPVTSIDYAYTRDMEFPEGKIFKDHGLGVVFATHKSGARSICFISFVNKGIYAEKPEFGIKDGNQKTINIVGRDGIITADVAVDNEYGETVTYTDSQGNIEVIPVAENKSAMLSKADAIFIANVALGKDHAPTTTLSFHRRMEELMEETIRAAADSNATGQKVAVIGLRPGSWGMGLIEQLIKNFPDIKIYGFARARFGSLRSTRAYRNLRSASKGRLTLKRTSKSDDMAAKFNKIPKDVNICIITTPGNHFEDVKQALLLGKHVFCEKPITLTKEQADELISLAEQNKVILAVDYEFLFAPQVVQLAEDIKNNESGKVGGVELYLQNKKRDDGKIQQGIDVFQNLGVHLLSILHRVWGKGKIEGLKVVSPSGDILKDLNVEFDYVTKDKRLPVKLFISQDYTEHGVRATKRLISLKTKAGATIKDINLTLDDIFGGIAGALKAFLEAVENNEPPINSAAETNDIVENMETIVKTAVAAEAANSTGANNLFTDTQLGAPADLKAIFLDKAKTLAPFDDATGPQVIEPKNIEAVIRAAEAGLDVVIVTADTNYDALLKEVVTPIVELLKIHGKLENIAKFHLIKAHKVGSAKTINEYIRFYQDAESGLGYKDELMYLTSRPDDIIDKGKAINIALGLLGISSGTIIRATDDAKKDISMFDAQPPAGILAVDIYVGEQEAADMSARGVIVSPQFSKYTSATYELLNHAAVATNNNLTLREAISIWKEAVLVIGPDDGERANIVARLIADYDIVISADTPEEAKSKLAREGADSMVIEIYHYLGPEGAALTADKIRESFTGIKVIPVNNAEDVEKYGREKKLIATEA